MDAAGGRIMFITTKETLITKGLLSRVRDAGRDIFCVTSAEDIARCGETPDAVIYCMNDEEEKYAAVHAAILGLLEGSGIKLSLIATKEQYARLTEELDASLVESFFERPLNMERFLDAMASNNGMGRKKRILIVDDDAGYRQFIREWLKDSYDISMAGGGEQAVKLIALQSCDLILLDYDMPGVSGPQAMEMIRAVPSTEHTPIIFLTGRDDENSLQTVKSLRPAGYLLKPVSRAELVEMVERTLAER